MLNNHKLINLNFQKYFYTKIEVKYKKINFSDFFREAGSSSVLSAFHMKNKIFHMKNNEKYYFSYENVIFHIKNIIFHII